MPDDIQYRIACTEGDGTVLHFRNGGFDVLTDDDCLQYVVYPSPDDARELASALVAWADTAETKAAQIGQAS